MTVPYQTLPAIPPSQMTRLTSIAPVRETRFGAGYVHRRLTSLSGPDRQWLLVWQDLDRSDLDRLDQFLAAHRGLTAFYWTPPGLPGPGLYICQRWQITPQAGSRSDLTARLIPER